MLSRGLALPRSSSRRRAEPGGFDRAMLTGVVLPLLAGCDPEGVAGLLAVYLCWFLVFLKVFAVLSSQLLINS